jgi:hypothetical protein
MIGARLRESKRGDVNVSRARAQAPANERRFCADDRSARTRSARALHRNVFSRANVAHKV